MMNMMYPPSPLGFGWAGSTTGPRFGFVFSLLWSVHILSVIAFVVGVLLLLFWAFKHLTPKQLKQWGWTLVIIGSIGCLLTIGIMGHPWNDYGSMPMMGAWQNVSGTKSADQLKEEADGKALYDKLQAKETSCADLSDDDFELIGEYLMGLRAGANHEQMNAMIKQMNGGDDAPMHIFIAKNATGCAEGTQGTEPSGWMMRGMNAASR